MTPFGIRKKLRALLDGGRADPPPPAPEPIKFKVSFDCPDGTNYNCDASEGDSLVLASGRGPQPIATGCADSSCGTCQVEVLGGDGQLTECDEHETRTKEENGVPAEFRLGCQTGVLGEGVHVRIVTVLGMEEL